MLEKFRIIGRWIMILLASIIIVTPIYIFLVFEHVFPPPFDLCVRETRKTYTNLHGFSFIVVDSDCDMFAHTEFIDVYATTVGVQGRTRLFQYGAGSYDDPLPDIFVSDRNDISIRVAEVSYVNFQLREWQGRKIAYDIGKIHIPASLSRRPRPMTDGAP